MGSFITYPIITNAQDLMTRGFNYLKGLWPTWSPAEGNLDTAIIELVADQQADIATMSTQVPTAIFRTLGKSLFLIPAIEATAATCTSTWYLNDTLGHTIKAGTQVGIRDPLNNLIAFRVVIDVIVPSGSNTTAAGAVLLIAAIPGAAADGIGTAGGNIELLDTYTWVDHIDQVATTANGVDAETDSAYLDRLVVELSTITPRPILGPDFAILARNVAGVQRAVAIDGYNPSDGTTDNERMVCIFSQNSTGQPVSSDIKTAVSAYLESLREMNFVVNTADPDMNEIDITVGANLEIGYSNSDVAARLQTAILDYFNPLLWGISPTDDPNNPLTWNNQTIIRYLDLAHTLSNITGVAYLNSLTFGLHGDSQSSADLTLTGKVPLPFTQVADLVISVS